MEDILFVAMAVLLIITYGWGLIQRYNVIRLIREWESTLEELTKAEKLLMTYELLTDVNQNDAVREMYDKISAEMKEDSH